MDGTGCGGFGVYHPGDSIAARYFLYSRSAQLFVDFDLERLFRHPVNIYHQVSGYLL